MNWWVVPRLVCMVWFRFIAVTRPIQYAKHRSTYRVPLTVAMTWVVSIIISSPIVLGANYTEHRSDGTEVWPQLFLSLYPLIHIFVTPSRVGIRKCEVLGMELEY